MVHGLLHAVGVEDGAAATAVMVDAVEAYDRARSHFSGQREGSGLGVEDPFPLSRAVGTAGHRRSIYYTNEERNAKSKSKCV